MLYCIAITAILMFVLQILIVSDPESIEDPLQTIVSLLEGTWYYNRARSKVLYFNQVQNPSTKLWLSLHVKKMSIYHLLEQLSQIKL